MTWIRDNELLIWLISGLSAVTFVATLIAIPVLIVRMPADYFVREDSRHWPEFRPSVRFWLIAGKNLLGAILLPAGIAMLVLPGQGLLTLMVGIMLLDFPGKRRLEGWLVRRRPIYRAINWIRSRRHRAPLRIPGARQPDRG